MFQLGNTYLLVPWCDQSDQHLNQEETSKFENLGT